MTRRQLGILLVVLVLLLGVIALKRLQPVEELATEEAVSLELSLDSGAIDEMAIWKGSDETSGVTLRRLDGLWRLPDLWNVRAKQEKVTQVLDSLRSISGELRGRSESLYEDFGLTEDSALHLRSSQAGTIVADLLLNPAASGWQSFFIRKADSPEVFLVTDSSLLSRLGAVGPMTADNLKPSAWADFRIIELDDARVTGAEIKERGGDWRALGDPLPFGRDIEKIRSYVRGLASLQAGGAVDPEGEGCGLDDPEWILRFILEDGDSVALTVGAVRSDSNDERYVKVSNAAHVYYVSPAALERLRVDGSRFVADNPLAIGKESLKMITVKAGDQEASAALEGESWDGLDNYLEVLKAFRVQSVSALPERTPRFEEHRMRVERTDQTALTIACETPPEDANEIICRNEENQIPFAIARSTFEQLFGDLGRLTPPQGDGDEASEEPAKN